MIPGSVISSHVALRSCSVPYDNDTLLWYVCAAYYLYLHPDDLNCSPCKIYIYLSIEWEEISYVLIKLLGF